MRITLLKSGKYPDTEADMGKHVFTYALLPHAGNVANGDTIEEATKLNLPVHILPGVRSAFDHPIEIDSRNIIVDAFKPAEDGNSIILRIHECRGDHACAHIAVYLPVRSYCACNLAEEQLADPIEGGIIEAELRPFEIQTYRLQIIAKMG